MKPQEAYLDSIRLQRIANTAPMLYLQGSNRWSELDGVKTHEAMTEHYWVLGRDI